MNDDDDGDDDDDDDDEWCSQMDTAINWNHHCETSITYDSLDMYIYIYIYTLMMVIMALINDMDMSI